MTEEKSAWSIFRINPLPYAMVSLPLMIQKKYEDALVYLNKGLELSPENSPMKAQFYAYLGESFYVLDSVERAFKMFDEVLKINPNDIMTLNNYSYYLSIRNERLNDAERMSAKRFLPIRITLLFWILMPGCCLSRKVIR